MKQYYKIGLSDFIKVIDRLHPEDDQTISYILEILQLHPITSDKPFISNESHSDAGSRPIPQPRPTTDSSSPSPSATPDSSRLPSEMVQLPSLSREQPEWLIHLRPFQREPSALPELPPFTPLLNHKWTRSILSDFLSTMAQNGEIDTIKIIDLLVQGRALNELPRRNLPTLRKGVQILVDISESMIPFKRDQEHIMKEIASILPADCIEILYFEGAPSWGVYSDMSDEIKPYAPPMSGTPILMLTDLGIGHPPHINNQSLIAEWMRFAQGIHSDKQPIVALVPYARYRWPRSLMKLMLIYLWDTSNQPRKEPFISDVVNDGQIPLEIEKQLNATARKNPAILELARHVSLATRIEPELIRTIRSQILPFIEAGAEADLWFSSLTQFRNMFAMFMYPEVVTYFRKQLASDPVELQHCWLVLQQFRQKAPQMLKLEEELVYLGLAPEANRGMIEAKVGELLQAVLNEDDTENSSLVRWTLQAVRNFPEQLRDLEIVNQLTVAAMVRSPDRQLSGPQLLPKIEDYAWLLPKTMPVTTIGIRLVASGIEFSDPPAKDSVHIISQVPRTSPRIINVKYDDTIEIVELYDNGTLLKEIPHNIHKVEILTISGERYELYRSLQSAVIDEGSTSDLQEHNQTGVFQHIGEALRLGSTSLSLANLQLTSLPSEIVRLTQLENLDLSHNQLTSLSPEIGQLAKLKTLNVSHNALEQLPIEISYISNLQSLNFSDNSLIAMPPWISQLVHLDELNLSYNKISIVPPEIGQMTYLQILDLSHNQLISLPPEIGELSKLETLNISHNALEQLPIEISYLSALRLVNFGNNPLKALPPEITAMGSDTVLSYLREQTQSGVRNWRGRLILVGEGGVGKTSLLRRLQGETYNFAEDTTQGIDIQEIELSHPVENATMLLSTWDFGGQEIYHATYQFFLTNRSLFLLVWNARHGYEQGKLYYWLDTIKNLAPESPILMVATHIDERTADLPLTEIKVRYPQVTAFLEISSRTGEGIERLRAAIQQESANLPMMGELWPSTWLNAANMIRANQAKYISQQELRAIMEQNGLLAESYEVLTRWLHELGDILYFQEDIELSDTVILKPQWVSECIARVLTSSSVMASQGIFTRHHMDEIWGDVPLTIREHLLRLMEKFDLSYRIPDDPQNRSLVVERLPYDEADYHSQWEAIQDREPCNEISMKFVLNSTMPSGIPSWFIARAHRFTTHTHWRYGTLLIDAARQHLGLLRAFPHERYIHLAVRGPYPHNFFALLRDGVEVIFSRFPGLEIRRMIPCPGHDGKPCTYEFAYENLERAFEKNVASVQCAITFESVPIAQLVFGLNSPSTSDLIIKRLDEMRDSQQQLTLTNELHELRALAQREFTNIYRRAQVFDESQCPFVFTLKPYQGEAWERTLEQKAELRLYCQAPGHWHPPTKNGSYPVTNISDITGNYIITLSRDWLIKILPHLKRLAKILQFSAPIISTDTPVLPVFADSFKAEINQTENLVNLISNLQLDNGQNLDENTGEISIGETGDTTSRALRALLSEVDPHLEWGRLKKVLTPEGHYLWLCAYHAAEYR